MVGHFDCQARLEELDAFKSDAIELAAGKVASLSGDIRRALQMCRRAAEIAARRVAERAGDGGASTSSTRVTVADIVDAAKELSACHQVTALSKASEWQRGVIAALTLHLKATDGEDAPFDAVFHRLKTMLAKSFPDAELPTFSEVCSLH